MEQCLYHYGVKGMKWGHRKERVSIGRDLRRLRSQYRKEYKAKKMSGQSTRIGKGPHSMNLSKTNYAEYKAHQALVKKYGSTKVNAFKKKQKNRTLKAGAALAGASLAGLGGMTVAAMIKKSLL